MFCLYCSIQTKKGRIFTRHNFQVDDDEPSEMDESEEEIEEIVTEGARGLPAADPASDPTAAAVAVPTSRTGDKAVMNKVDHRVTTQQIVDGRAVTGMYQVVHRVETISTTTLPVVPDHGEKQVRHITCVLGYR